MLYNTLVYLSTRRLSLSCILQLAVHARGFVFAGGISALWCFEG